MKKSYIKPEMMVYHLHSMQILAGSINAGDQTDPSMAPLFGEEFEMIPGLEDPLFFGF